MEPMTRIGDCTQSGEVWKELLPSHQNNHSVAAKVQALRADVRVDLDRGDAMWPDGETRQGKVVDLCKASPQVESNSDKNP